MYNSNVSVGFIGDGETKEFNFTFNIFRDDYIDVYINREIQASGYKVASTNYENGGGVVVFDEAPKQGDEIKIIRNLPIKRTTDFKEGGPFRASRVNGEFDYQVGCFEQLDEKIDRAILKPVSLIEDINLSLPIPEKGKALIWDTKELGLKNSELNIDELMIDIKNISGSAELAIEAAKTATKAAEGIENKANNSLNNLNMQGQEIIDSKANKNFSNITEENAHKLIGNRFWESDEINISQNGLINISLPEEVTKSEGFNHRKCQTCFKVVCKVPEYGYTPGMYDMLPGTTYGSGNYFTYPNPPVQPDNTIKIRLGINLYVTRLDTSGYNTVTLDNWKIVLRVLY